MSPNKKNKIAFVTGSSVGIGKSVLLKLAENGYVVVIHYFHNINEAKKVSSFIKSKYGYTPLLVCADVRSESDVKNAFRMIKRKYGKLDVLVNNVGNYIKKPLEKLSSTEWHEILNSNLNSTFYCVSQSICLLKKSLSPRIINIGYASSGQMIAKPNILPYQIAKTGVLLMTKSYAKELARYKVLVNMISPGVMENSVTLPKNEIPLKKIGRLEDFSRLVLEVINHDYMTGAHIEYAGGFNL